jgi:hypothetical protein
MFLICSKCNLLSGEIADLRKMDVVPFSGHPPAPAQNRAVSLWLFDN